MVAGKCTGGELRRRRRFGLTSYGDAEGKERGEEVQEARVLTLSTYSCSSEAEES